MTTQQLDTEVGGNTISPTTILNILSGNDRELRFMDKRREYVLINQIIPMTPFGLDRAERIIRHKHYLDYNLLRPQINDFWIDLIHWLDKPQIVHHDRMCENYEAKCKYLRYLWHPKIKMMLLNHTKLYKEINDIIVSYY